MQTGTRNKPRGSEKSRQRQRVLHPFHCDSFKPAAKGNAGRRGCPERSALRHGNEASIETRNSENEKRKGKAVLSPVSLPIGHPTPKKRRKGRETLDGLARDSYQSQSLTTTKLRLLNSWPINGQL